MIKRRFYRRDHGERGDASSDSSSSSSDSDLDAQISADSDAEPQTAADSDVEPAQNHEGGDDEDDDEDKDDDDDDDDDGVSSLKPQLPSSSSSGYESEDSSAYEIDADSAGLPTVADDSETVRDGEQHLSLVSKKENDRIGETLAEDVPVADDIPSCILRCKSVFKCRLCPKIVCLNMETLKTHLQSKRHARSEKLLSDGRLKRILNSDGEEEVVSDDDGETHAERHARIVALAQSQSNSKKKSRGRQRQRERLKRKKPKNSSDVVNSGKQTENRSKRRRKNVD